MLVGRVVGDEVDDDPQAQLARLAQHRVGVLEGAEHRVYAAEVADVVAAVGHRRGEPRRDPEPVDAEVGEVGELGPQAREVALAVAVPVGEAARIHLVHHGGAPPRAAGILTHGGTPSMQARADLTGWSAAPRSNRTPTGGPLRQLAGQLASMLVSVVSRS